jgi:NTP pyrophosphatase (non-canonical NTP hydrolase)
MRRILRVLNEEMEKKCLEIARFYGFDAQTNQLIEECAELIQAINKYKRQYLRGQPVRESSDGKAPRDMIAEEIADVEVMMCQIKYLLHITDLEVEDIAENKIERTMMRMEETTREEQQ